MNTHYDINKALSEFKKMTARRIDDKFLVVHPCHYVEIIEILDSENIIIDVYEHDYCDQDKVYLVDKLAIPYKCDNIKTQRATDRRSAQTN